PHTARVVAGWQRDAAGVEPQRGVRQRKRVARADRARRDAEGEAGARRAVAVPDAAGCVARRQADRLFYESGRDAAVVSARNVWRREAARPDNRAEVEASDGEGPRRDQGWKDRTAYSGANHGASGGRQAICASGGVRI